MKEKKNVILIVVDQMRYDCMGINGNNIISTPNLNYLASEGYNFSNAYSTIPSCLPARASLITGLKAENHGRVGYEDEVEWNYPLTLATVFSERGYYTKCVGKMHVYPARKLCGFHHIDLHDGYLHSNRKFKKKYGEQFAQTDDYLEWVQEKLGNDVDLTDLGLDCNSWVARPWQYEEKYHPTNWVVTKGLEFLRKRDMTMPFFLKLSFVRPHSPLDPPEYYFNMYMEQADKFPEVISGNWEKATGYSEKTNSIIAKKGIIPEHELKRAIAAYYGSITHIDHQIGRLLIGLEEHDLFENTVIVFMSDHGDQLGEHNLFRKAYPYQGSIHIPLIVYEKGKKDILQKESIDEIIEIRDILPTLVELGTGETENRTDGKSFAALMDTENESLDNQKIASKCKIHDFLHGEHEMGEYSTQFILTKEWKYIWYSQTGEEQLFNLKKDPDERKDLINEKEYSEIIQELRRYLIESLTGREEKYVENGRLVIGKHPKPTLNCLKK